MNGSLGIAGPRVACTSGQRTQRARKGKNRFSVTGARSDKSQYRASESGLPVSRLCCFSQSSTGDLGNRLLSVLISLSHPQISGSLFTIFDAHVPELKTPNPTLTGKVKIQMRL